MSIYFSTEQANLFLVLKESVPFISHVNLVKKETKRTSRIPVLCRDSMNSMTSMLFGSISNKTPWPEIIFFYFKICRLKDVLPQEGDRKVGDIKLT